IRAEDLVTGGCMKISRLIVAASLAIAVLVPAFGEPAADSARAASQPASAAPRFSREKITGIIANARKIVTQNGVEELLEVPLGGAKQWISVRGRDRANPVLLMIHGGPASPEMPTSWYFQNGWEDYFTVVQWDQRGSGKTYNANDPKTIQPTLSLARITADAGELVQYLRSRYGKQKIFVLGHSWGSLVGLSLARQHPEWLYAYVGMGQVINGREGEHVGYEETLRIAEATGNSQAVKDLQALAPYPNADGSLPVAKVDGERKWSVEFGGLTWGRKNLDYYFDLTPFSPEYTDADLAAIDKGSQLSLARLLPDLAGFNFSEVTEWRCPIILFLGRHDLTTPSVVASAWLERVHAPQKKLIWFENSAHMMMVEEPGRMLVHLVEDVRPLAK
ncbi:MAG TPA: alpha/beta hydrolase, partial [Steroidobacteraceae bacterium]|nr:alpha/beta hydrolase [Steroidobacteraceae bacterium]